MSRIIANRGLAHELIQRGLVPENCRLIDVLIEVEGVVLLRYEKYLTQDESRRFGAAMIATAGPEEDSEGDR